MTPNDTLLAAIRARGQKQTEFGHGIQTADVFVRTLAERIGLDSCYKFVSTRRTSFDDLLQKAGRTLVYSNPDMQIEEKDVDQIRKQHDIELPKNTLMVFRLTLTTSNKDRDGDILHAGGAKPDPNMLLLWQHLHTMPIGKTIAVAEQTDDYLKMVSCIVDMNETSHDAAVMVDNDMGRFSHGFRAIDFEEIKEGDKKKPAGSYEIKEFEIMEESLVSVPANIDATTEEVMLSLVEGGKLTSPMMKEYGKMLREKQPTQVQVPVMFREIQCGSLGELKQAHDAGLIAGAVQEKNSERPDDKAGTAGTPKKTDEADADKGDADGGKEEGSDTEIVCPECGGKIKDGKCSKCGHVMPKLDEGKSEDEKAKDMVCPECGYAFKKNKKAKDVVCPDCGYAFSKEDMGKSYAVEAKFYAPLSDSYEWIKEQLQPQVQKLLAPEKDEYCYIEATFADYVVVQKSGRMSERGEYFYRIAWMMKDGKPMLEGEAKEVEIEPARVLRPKSFDTKQGRIISKANETRIQDAVDDLKEVDKLSTTRPVKALVKKATSTLISVLKQIETPESQEQQEQSPMSLFIASATPVDRKQMKKLLETFDKVEQRAKEVKRYRAMHGKTRQAK